MQRQREKQEEVDFEATYHNRSAYLNTGLTTGQGTRSKDSSPCFGTVTEQSEEPSFHSVGIGVGNGSGYENSR